jgi:hypothetical protein
VKTGIQIDIIRHDFWIPTCVGMTKRLKNGTYNTKPLEREGGEKERGGDAPLYAGCSPFTVRVRRSSWRATPLLGKAMKKRVLTPLRLLRMVAKGCKPPQKRIPPPFVKVSIPSLYKEGDYFI